MSWPRPLVDGAVLVGGAVRDALMDLSPRDLDWLVPDIEAALGQLRRRPDSEPVQIDPSRLLYRVQIAGVWNDFAPIQGSLADELRRRDFSVDALAWSPGSGLVDPVGGRADLRRRRLRMVAEANLRADPLRLLRGARLIATHGLRAEPETEAALGRCAADLASRQLAAPAPERVGAELDLLLCGGDPVSGLRALERWGALAIWIPELAATSGVWQGGFHHLDVYHHSLLALAELVRLRPRAPLDLRWATLLHDLGKPASRSQDAFGRYHFYGHAELGAALASSRLLELRRPRGLAERVSALIAAHMLPLPGDLRLAKRFVHRRGELLPDLLDLMIADRQAARGPLSNQGTRLAYQQGIDRVLQAMESPRPAAPLLDGHQIMAALGLPPGPLIGRLLAELAEAQAVGDLETSEQATEYLRRRLAALRAGQN